MNQLKSRKQNRLNGYDYSLNGYYFITVCVQNKEHIFGDIVAGAMVLNNIGEIVQFTWMDLKRHNTNIELDEFIIMPNHIHGIIIIKSVGAGSKPAQIPITQINVNNNGHMTDFNRAGLEPAPTGHGLSEIVRQFKTFSTKQINKIRQTPGKHLWQRSFYDHIIRAEQSLNKIREYIHNNPSTWETDENNIENYSLVT